MFVLMDEMLTWPEKLERLSEGDKIEVLPDVNVQSVYSAIRNHYKDSDIEFSIRKDKKTKKRFLYRLK